MPKLPPFASKLKDLDFDALVGGRTWSGTYQPPGQDATSRTGLLAPLRGGFLPDAELKSNQARALRRTHDAQLARIEEEKVSFCGQGFVHL